MWSNDWFMQIFRLHSVLASPSKIYCRGEGGVVTTNDENIYRALKRARSHGIIQAESDFHNPKDALTNGVANPWYYEMVELGFHYRFTDIQATLATSQLRKLEFHGKKAPACQKVPRLDRGNTAHNFCSKCQP